MKDQDLETINGETYYKGKRVVKLSTDIRPCYYRSILERTPAEHDKNCNECGGNYFLIHGFSVELENGSTDGKVYRGGRKVN